MRPPLNPLAASTILCLAAAATILATATTRAATIYVDSVNGNDAWSGLCETWDGGTCGPKRLLTAAIATAGIADIIQLGNGMHPVTGTQFAGKNITITALAETTPTVTDSDPVDGADSLVFINSQVTIKNIRFQTVGCRIEANTATETLLVAEDCEFILGLAGHALATSGAYPVTLVARRCRFSGAPSVRNSDAAIRSIGQGAWDSAIRDITLVDCTFERLDARAIDIAVTSQSSVVVDRCTFIDNSSIAGFGGGAARLLGSPNGHILVQNCVFIGNRVLKGDSSADAIGGAVFLFFATVKDCRFAHNISDESGGAAWIRTCNVSNSVFVENSAQTGGALFVSGEESSAENCELIRNYALLRGGAIASNALSLKLDRSTLVDNFSTWLGGGVSATGTALNVSGSIIYGNQDTFGTDERAQIDYCCADIDVSHSNIQGWTGTLPGVGSFDADPLFADPANDDYHLLPGSPCIDAGALCSDGVGQFDLDGEPRVMNGRIDIGADEFTAAPFLDGDMNCDAFRTVSDIAGFVLALTDPAAYAAAFPACNVAHADINRDGVVTVGDISNFVAALTCAQ